MDVNSVVLNAPMPAPVPQQGQAPEAPVAYEEVRQPVRPQQVLRAQQNQDQKREQAEDDAKRDMVERAVEHINKSLVAFDREMRISIHDRLKRIMVKVIDTQENRVIREIPPEKVLDAFARTLELAGILLDKQR